MLKKGIKVQLQLNFTFCGKRVVLGTEIEGKDADPNATAEKVFYGGTVGLNLSLAQFFQEIQTKLGLPADTIPDSLIPNITFKDIVGRYDGKSKELYLMAVADVKGKEVRAFFQYFPSPDGIKANSSYVIGMVGDLADLSGLPLVGGALENIQILNVGFIYTSKAGDYALPILGDEPSEEDIADDPFVNREITLADKKQTYQQGFHLIGGLKLSKDGEVKMFVMPMSKKMPATTAPATTAPATTTAPEKVTDPKPAFNAGSKWYNLSKVFGPVTINKVGFSYREGRAKIMLSASLKFGPLKVSLEGLGVSFILKDVLKGDLSSLSFGLSGLGFSFIMPPIKIAAMFILAEPKEDEIISFYGGAEIGYSNYSIAGIGGFSTLKSGQVSLFIFAAFNGPIGGIPEFFVTGVAAGFGFNRALRMPTMQEVMVFPLVELAVASDPDRTLLEVVSDLVSKDWIYSSPGDYWLAVGIKFTTYKMLESFVLVAFQVGVSGLEVAVIGVSAMGFPVKGATIAYLELAIMARFSLANGFIAVEAAITSNSYLLDKNCTITGGFAFYIWMWGKNQGDFVLSLGGYHPEYKVPAHYPQVDRLGLRWKINNEVSVTGEIYFALTPRCIMAGGKWEVLFDIGFIRATLRIWANVMIAWAPFQYQIDAGVTIYIEANIRIWFINIYFKLEMGVQVRIWGPPFAGEAQVHWSIFKFTIPFGSSQKQLPAPLSWTEFKDSFVPKKPDDIGKEGILDTRIIAGIISVIKNEQTGEIVRSFVNPYQLVLGLDSFFPLKNAAYANTQMPENTQMFIIGEDIPVSLSNRNNEFGVKSMQRNDLNSQLDFELKRGGNTINNVKLLANAKGVPHALWGRNDNDPDVIKKVFTGVEIHATEEVDNTIIVVNTNDRDVKTLTNTINYMVNKDARGRENEASIRDFIAGKINLDTRKTIGRELFNMGFEIDDVQDLNYDALNLRTPEYIAAVGQKIPKIRYN